MATKDLEKFLRQIQSGKGRGFDVEESKREWLRAIDSLLERISGWLEPVAQKGLVKLHRNKVTISEDSLGVYEAPCLEIEAVGRRVVLEPVARVVFGGAGRIDMGHGRLARVLIREPNENNRWLISSAYTKGEGAVLTDETFTEALQSLLS